MSIYHEHRELTHREKDVLRCIVDGMNNNEIANALTVSIHTIKAHVGAILEKMGVDSRVAIAVKAVRERLLEDKNEDKNEDE